MRKILLCITILFSVSVQAQSHYDYMDDYTASGGVDGALNFLIILFFLVIVVLVFGFISVVIYWFSPQKERNKLEREKAERDIVEMIKNRLIEQEREQERKRALLALPKNIIHLTQL